MFVRLHASKNIKLVDFYLLNDDNINQARPTVPIQNHWPDPIIFHLFWEFPFTVVNRLIHQPHLTDKRSRLHLMLLLKKCFPYFARSVPVIDVH